MEQTVLQIGNSLGISIPSSLRKKYKLQKGKKVLLKDTREGILITAHKGTPEESRATSKEFKKWLKEALREDEEILDELSVR